jgi:predicted  nucleic acid-binding Zn-ribbon protein
MLPDLARLIELQDVETRAAAAAKAVADAPGRIAALDAKLDATRAAVEAAKKDLADNGTSRRSVDKDLIAAQQRLDKYKEQLMAVKTNDEYHAMQHQIEAAKREIGQHEERILELMMAADEVNARLKKAEAQLKADQASITAERSAIEKDAAVNQTAIVDLAAKRAALISQIDKSVVATFERVARVRGGIALARAEGERCVVCQVRMRPQVFNHVRQNEQILQCENCQRILYFVPPSAAPPPQPTTPA